jgi:hypothetical protein
LSHIAEVLSGRHDELLHESLRMAPECARALERDEELLHGIPQRRSQTFPPFAELTRRPALVSAIGVWQNGEG